MQIMNILPLADTASATASDANSVVSTLWMFGSIALMLLLLYFFLIRPQRKKEKKLQKMQNGLEVGDEVTTSGGIVGRVVSIKEDSIIIETGADRNKIRIKKWAIQSCNTIHENNG